MKGNKDIHLLYSYGPTYCFPAVGTQTPTPTRATVEAWQQKMFPPCNHHAVLGLAFHTDGLSRGAPAELSK